MFDRPESVEARHGAAIGAERAASVRWRALARLAREAWGLPRHASQHPGGMVISTRPLIDICPVQPAAMEGRQLVQWDKDSCADAGFLKIDLLGLGMLSAVERCVEEIARVRGERIDLSRIPMDDPETFRAIRAADTTGVFQIESRAQMQMLPRTRPENLDDLTVQVALVRPGPIQGGAVHPYLERRERLRKDPAFRVPYEHPSLEPILRDTLGAIVFQEQVIQVAMALAGFSAGEAEGLRRAMSRKRSEEAILAYREQFIAGAMRARRDAGGGGARLRAGPRLLGVRVPEGPRGRLRPARLPVDLAAGPLRTRVPLRALERAADGLLSAGRAGARGAAAGDRGAAAGRQPQRRGVLGRASGRHEGGREPAVRHRPRLHRPGLPAEEGAPGARRRARARRRLIRAWPTSRRARAWAATGSSAWRGRGRARGSAGGTTCGDARICGSSGRPGGGGGPPGRGRRKWRAPREAAPARVQLSLPLPFPPRPRCASWTRGSGWSPTTRSIGIAIAEHPMALLRPSLRGRVASSRTSTASPDGGPWRSPGWSSRASGRRPRKGVVFMLLEDELGTINVVVPPPVYERHRLAVRTASFALVERQAGAPRRGRQRGRLGPAPARHAGPPRAEVRHIEPPAERETGRDGGTPARRRRSRGPPSSPPSRPPRTASAAARDDAGSACPEPASSLAEHMFRPSRAPTLPAHVPRA